MAGGHGCPLWASVSVGAISHDPGKRDDGENAHAGAGQVMRGFARAVGGRLRRAILAALLLAGATATTVPPSARANTSAQVPVGKVTAVPTLTGLEWPSAVAFADDGSVFVAEQAGIVKFFRSAEDAAPAGSFDLRREVHFSEDRGLLGVEVHPEWPQVPWIWVFFTADSMRWDTDGNDTGRDPCPGTPPALLDNPTAKGGYLPDGCLATASLVRFVLDPQRMQVVERFDLITGEWCGQFPSHSVGSVLYGQDGALYVAAGDGAAWRGYGPQFLEPDYGQHGGEAEAVGPENPCGDPLGGVGADMDPVTSQGGSLRAQDILTNDDPLGLDGAVLRLDPETGQGMWDNPLAGGDPADDRHIAVGLRNPFRLAERPGTSELWIGDVGWDRWEEMDVIGDPRAELTNFGWPCYEGADPLPEWQALGNETCGVLDSGGLHTPPRLAYPHVGGFGECANGSVISGLGFYEGGRYPALFDGALFYADAYTGCTQAVWLDDNGNVVEESAARIESLDNKPIVDIQPGPLNDLYFLSTGPTGTLFRLVPREQNCPSDDSFEPNDVQSEATPRPAGDLAAVACDEEDWYRYRVLPGDLARVLVNWDGDPSVSTLTIDVYDDDGLLESVEARPGTALNVRPGTENLYIRVTPDPGLFQEYTLSFGRCFDDDTNDTGQTSVPIDAAPEQATHCPGERDWFHLPAEAGHRLVTELSFPITTPKLTTTVVAPTTVAGSRSTTNGDERATFPIRNTGVAKVIVGGADVATTSPIPYSLAAHVMSNAEACAGPGDAWEPNGSRFNAAAPPAWPVLGDLCGVEHDYFSAPVVAGRPFSASLEFDRTVGDLDLALVNAAGNVVSTATGTETGAVLHHIPAATEELRLWVTSPDGSLIRYHLDQVAGEVVSRSVLSGNEVTTDVERDGATSNDPIETSIRARGFGAEITIREDLAIVESPPGFVFSGWRSSIEYDDSAYPIPSQRDPAQVFFDLDASLLPSWVGPSDVVVARDGQLLPPCTDPTTDQVADPNPCVQRRQLRTGGDIRIVVIVATELLDGAHWTFGWTLDETPPEITISSPVNGATYLLNQVVTASYSCTDPAPSSRIASCTGTIPSGQLLDTTHLGSHELTVTAEDGAGNRTTRTVAYRVAWAFTGFEHPIDDDILNVAKVGRHVPFRFRLTDANGTPVAADDPVLYFRIQTISCEKKQPKDGVEEYSARRSRRALGNGRYEVTFSADRSLASTCAVVTLFLDDGTEHAALMKYEP